MSKMKRHCKIIDDKPVFFEICRRCGEEFEFQTTYDGEDYEDCNVSGSGVCKCGNVTCADGIYRSGLKKLVNEAIEAIVK